MSECKGCINGRMQVVWQVSNKWASGFPPLNLLSTLNMTIEHAWGHVCNTNKWEQLIEKVSSGFCAQRHAMWLWGGHGAMSGTNFKKNQKSKTPYLVHYKLCYLKQWLSSMERFDLDCYYIDEVSSSITTGCIFFSEIYSLWLLLTLLFKYLCTKNLTLLLRNL